MTRTATETSPSISQYRQDRYVLDELLDGKRGGTFLEIGAFDGVWFSNTLLMERDYGWTGMCVEAIPAVFEQLQRNRSCVCVHAAASATSGGETTFEILSGSSAMLSGRLETQCETHKQRIARSIARNSHTSETVRVPTLAIADALRRHAMTRIDYASIDIEGGELDCLKGLLGPGISIGIVGIENNYGGWDIPRFMRDHGYLRIRRVGSDDFYRLREECTPAQRRDALAYPIVNWQFGVKNVRRKIKQTMRSGFGAGG